MPNFLKHPTAHPSVNISVSRRDRDTQGFCNLQIGLSGKCNIFRQGGEELLLSGRREMARLGFFDLRQGAEDFASVDH